MKKRKACIAVFTAAFLFGSLFASTALAADKPTVSLSDTAAEAGGSCTLTVSVKGFSQVTDPDGPSAATIDDLFSALQLKIYYDANVFTPETYGSAEETAGKASPVKLEGDWAADIVKRSDGRGDYIYCSFLCLSGDGVRLETGTDVADIAFSVKDTAKAGDYTFDAVIGTVVTGIKGEPKNVGGQFAVQDGSVRIAGGDTDPDTTGSDTSDTESTDTTDTSAGPEDSNTGDQASDSDTRPDDKTSGDDTHDGSNGQTSADAVTSTGKGGQSGRDNPKTGELLQTGIGILVLGLAAGTAVVLKCKSGK